ncbi:replication-relaxation family protein [Fodinicola feengrottensis]|uniref:replication-relaxation family protein n=1 Tax=Fodinicola feengrottensis TaxID=435914 RepID=UPI0036F40FA6
MQRVFRRTGLLRPRASGGYELGRWWSEKRATAALHRVARPDGHGVWVSGDTRVPWWLEFDTGSEGLRQVTEKLTGYAPLVGTQWNFPILFWFPTPARERAVRHALHRRVPPGLVVATASGRPETSNPAGAVWRVVGDEGAVRTLADIPVADEPTSTIGARPGLLGAAVDREGMGTETASMSSSTEPEWHHQMPVGSRGADTVGLVSQQDRFDR